MLDIPWKLKPSENLVTEKDNELAISGDVKITKTGDAAEQTQASPTDLIFTIKTVTQDNLSVQLGFILYKTSCFVSKLQTL